MDPAEAVRLFFQAWNTDNDAQRLALLRDCCATDAVFTDPQHVTEGVEALSASIGAFRRAFPRGVVRHGAPDEHHGQARVRWYTEFNDGTHAPISGDDFVELDSKFRIVRLVSFDGAPPGAT